MNGSSSKVSSEMATSTCKRLTRFLSASAIAFFVLSSCGSSSFLDAKDTVAAAGFEADQIMDDADYDALPPMGTDEIKGFLESGNPYGGSSFLTNYKGSVVAKSITAAVTAESESKHKVHPLLVLARLQASQGLISAKTAPTDKNRIDFVFGCGGNQKNSFDSTFAGLELQIKCYVSALKKAFKDLEAGQATASGWKKGETGVTVDNKMLTLRSDLAAVLYEYEPVVGDGTHGSSLTYNLLKLYRGN
jgi:hypothetical protein